VISIATMTIEQMRAAISVLYQGNWADMVAKMPDKQVAAIFQRNLDKVRRKSTNNSSLPKEKN
jgi:Mg/Co/Ni transporter MgtE